MVKNIVVVAIQGDYASHAEKAHEFFSGSSVFFAIKPEDIPSSADMIILPGGESSAISLISKLSGLDKKIISEAEKGTFIIGTCAGCILLSKKIANPGKAEPWKLIDITVERNAYGRQIDSSFKTVTFSESRSKLAGSKKCEGVFIRAPKITQTGKDTEVIADCQGSPVFVRQKNIFAMTFHPELSEGFEVYKIIEGIIRERQPS
ncbi:pyridoxal 5'-phosphate synthase glutaminase subunit PdxT [candidate division WOR-3 bacterium]|nr:pyridoxal 5'-phosphate synthase glutaminase subunit PdxT [candidate division WOR-3 bacterium]